MSVLTFLAEIFPQTEPFWEYSNPPAGLAAAFLLFVLLLCGGIAVDIGLAVHLVKRPVSLKALGGDLAARALPWRLIGLIISLLVLLYLINSAVYSLFFSEGTIEPHTLLFNALFFTLPVLIIIGWLFGRAGVNGRELFGLQWSQAPKRLGLALLLYVGALPVLWFYSWLYQMFLYQIGHEFYLQDVAQVLNAPAPIPVRISLIFIAVVVAPVFEELVFRGIFLPALVRKIGLFPGIMVISLVFALLHMHLPSLLPLFLLSAMFCFAFARTGSLLVPIGMHAAFNGVTVILLSLMS